MITACRVPQTCRCSGTLGQGKRAQQSRLCICMHQYPARHTPSQCFPPAGVQAAAPQQAEQRTLHSKYLKDGTCTKPCNVKPQTAETTHILILNLSGALKYSGLQHLVMRAEWQNTAAEQRLLASTADCQMNAQKPCSVDTAIMMTSTRSTFHPDRTNMTQLHDAAHSKLAAQPEH